MYKKQLLFFFGLMLSFYGFSQKVGFVNIEAVLKKAPEYNSAQEKLNELSVQYHAEISSKKEEIKKMYSLYQADKILLSQEMRLKKESEIQKAEDELDALKAQRFGENGDIFKERQKLIKPIQDKIYSSIQEVAEKGGFTMMLDVASNLGILYYSEKFDKTEDVLKKMGYL
jgi:outer membrane protein